MIFGLLLWEICMFKVKSQNLPGNEKWFQDWNYDFVATRLLSMNWSELKEEFFVKMFLGMSTIVLWICMRILYVRVWRKRQEKMLTTWMWYQESVWHVLHCILIFHILLLHFLALLADIGMIMCIGSYRTKYEALHIGSSAWMKDLPVGVTGE